MLPATNASYSLTTHNASASAYGQSMGLAWWIFGLLLAIIYFVVIYRLFWGKVSIANRARE
ncbi:hypothetical protein KSD_55840 [Ktedonobacter sp. SOSP1-85]|nr:hypothetical protein KSD_55840 [Ktedonobacter sp. SOSP1-85]